MTNSSPATTPGARLAARDLLAAVLDRGQPLDGAIATHGGLAALPARDRAFARLLAATVLRRLGQIDAAVAACLDKPLTPRASGIRHLLRLGAAQLLFLGTPPHAAVDATVDLAAGPRERGYRPLVNAVLRRLAREGADLVAAQDAPRLNTPDWLWASWTAAHGEAAARAIAAAHLVEAPTDLTVGDPATAERWAAALGAERLPTGSLRRAAGAGGAVPDWPGFGDGAWWVQDAAAALPARLLGAVAGRSVVDIGAAPGGKTAQLAAAGALVTAVDRSAARLERVAENLARLGLAAERVAADAALWRPAAPVDAVLLDAPCTATGTIRRHPDVARLKTPEDVTRLAAAQDRLLAAAASMLRPGGTLVFCTCSLEAAEGPERMAAAPALGLVPDPIRPEEIPGLDAEWVTEEGWLRTLPSHWPAAGGLDGFFAARFRRA